MPEDLIKLKGSKLAEKLGLNLAQKTSAVMGSVSGDAVLLLDRSGSMAAGVGAGELCWRFDGPSRIEELRKLCKQFPGVRKFQYNQAIQELKPGQEVGEPTGDNNEPVAFNFLKSLGIHEVVIITDGGFDDSVGTLKAAKGLKISALYVGPLPAPIALKQLVDQCGGTYAEGSLVELQKMVTTVKNLLLIDAPRGPIAL